MKLVIISHTPHYRSDQGLVGWGPTIREIDYLAKLFDTVVHIAPLHSEPSPASAIPYQSAKVIFHPVPPAGGTGLLSKLAVVGVLPIYGRAILREIRQADVVHVRCPANISLLALLLLSVVKHPRRRWIKYAGNWKPDGREAKSYAFQRWWLARNLCSSVVTVNGQWLDQPSHIRPLLNPCLTDEEITEAECLASIRQFDEPLRLLFVGQLHEAKGTGRALQILALLQQRGLNATLDLVGDGPGRSGFEALSRKLGIEQIVRFRGSLPRTELGPVYASAHILLLPSNSEGWPKVLSEAMAYGVVPIAASVSSIPEYLKLFNTGRAIPPHDLIAYVDAIMWYTQHPGRWRRETENGMIASHLFSYSNYLKSVQQLLGM